MHHHPTIWLHDHPIIWLHGYPTIWWHDHPSCGGIGNKFFKGGLGKEKEFCNKGVVVSMLEFVLIGAKIGREQ